MLNIDPQTYRFKFSDAVVNALSDFGGNNRGMDRKSFQKLWRDWLVGNKDLVEEEENRLNRLGFRGGAVDKMYKSVRYYFSKDVSRMIENQPWLPVYNEHIHDIDCSYNHNQFLKELGVR